ncbi:MAG: 6-bladed beta-propeller [Pseudomonadota bacterium]
MLKRHLIAILTATFVVGGCVVDDGGPAVDPRTLKKEPLVWPKPPEQPRFWYDKVLLTSADADPTHLDEFAASLTKNGQGLQGLGKPYGVAVHKGRVFVGDTAYKSIFVFDIPNKKFFSFGRGMEEPVKLEQPIGLDTDGEGNLYVTDNATKQVVVYNRDGKFQRTVGGPDYFDKPAGVAVDKNGDRVYVVDIGGIRSEQHKVAVFDAKNGQHLFDIGKRGSGPGEFNLPRDATIAPDGSLYVVDGANFRVQHFTRDGEFLNMFGSIGRMQGQFSRPKEVAVDADGNVYVIDSAFGNFQIFNPEGQLLMSVGGRGAVNAPAKYLLPSGIAVDGDGRVYVVDQMHRRVDIYRPDGLAKEDGYIGAKALSGIPYEPKPRAQ